MLSKINTGAAFLVSSILGFLGFIASLASGSAWALLFVVAGPTLAVLIHELGHAVAAWRCGMNVRRIAVGPLELTTRPFRFGLAKRLLGHDVGGYVAFDESRGRHLTRATDTFITASGPLANLACALACFAVANIAGDIAIGRLTLGFAYTSLAAFALSAWPLKLASGQGNDALRIVQMHRSDPTRFGRPKRSPWQAP